MGNNISGVGGGNIIHSARRSDTKEDIKLSQPDDEKDVILLTLANEPETSPAAAAAARIPFQVRQEQREQFGWAKEISLLDTLRALTSVGTQPGLEILSKKGDFDTRKLGDTLSYLKNDLEIFTKSVDSLSPEEVEKRLNTPNLSNFISSARAIAAELGQITIYQQKFSDSFDANSYISKLPKDSDPPSKKYMTGKIISQEGQAPGLYSVFSVDTDSIKRLGEALSHFQRIRSEPGNESFGQDYVGVTLDTFISRLKYVSDQAKLRDLYRVNTDLTKQAGKLDNT